MRGLHVTSLGPREAPRLVFLHGFLGTGDDWRTLADQLHAGWRIDLVDLPGHGKSTGLDAAAYTWAGCLDRLAALAEGATALAGYSMGGRLALGVALSGRVALKALVVISASPGLEGESARTLRAQEDDRRGLALEAQGLPDFLAAWYEQPLFASLAHQPGLKRELLARRARGDASELARALRGFSVGRQPSGWPGVAELRMPSLWMAGADDAAYAAVAQRAAGLSPNAAAFMVPHSGHMPHLEQPQIFRDGMRTFLDQHVE